MRQSIRVFLLSFFMVLQSLLPIPVHAESLPEQKGEQLLISEPGTYTLTGAMQGSVCVDPKAGDVRLILDNVTIQANNQPAIQALSGDSLTLEMAQGSVNRLYDSASNQAD
ncbi:MAG: carbohydrate-binding domain-containing protein, partial [Erysipelotrichaceae bacterium]|nr:carbohydrate-binding domain-containing protein [Erysipelotrichaceae bacterium]